MTEALCARMVGPAQTQVNARSVNCVARTLDGLPAINSSRMSAKGLTQAYVKKSVSKFFAPRNASQIAAHSTTISRQAKQH